MIYIRRYFADRNSLDFLRISIIAVMTAADFADIYFLNSYSIIMWIIFAIFTVTGVFVSGIYLPLYFKNLAYFISNDRIRRVSGVFFKAERVMRIEAVQYITTVTMPVLKWAGMNFIIINAFGGRTILAFLSTPDMKEISTHILQKINMGDFQE